MNEKEIKDFRRKMNIVRQILLAVRCRRDIKFYNDMKAEVGFSDDDFAEAAGFITGFAEQPIRVIASSEGGCICGVRANVPLHFSSLDQDNLEEKPEKGSPFMQNYKEAKKLDEEFEELPEAVY